MRLSLAHGCGLCNLYPRVAVAGCGLYQCIAASGAASATCDYRHPLVVAFTHTRPPLEAAVAYVRLLTVWPPLLHFPVAVRTRYRKHAP
ncbi:hypothetical protein GW17_00025866 [Ensete ventricosum]|nr:hypothetical protein GW17_00025866 [Ensete ventricosum]